MKKTSMMIILVYILTAWLIVDDITSMEDFNFSLQYNVGGRDFISTYDNILTVDTVAGIKTVEFHLSDKDKRRIKGKIESLGIMEEDFASLPKSGLVISPLGKYNLMITLNGVEKRAYWTTEYINPIVFPIKEKPTDPASRYEGEYGRVNKLFDLKNFIVDIIMEYETFKSLPKHKMYL